MIDDLFDRIRAATATVMRRAQRVRIDEGRVAALAGALNAVPPPDVAHRRFSDSEATAAFVLCLNAINFGSGWFPYLQKRAGCSGYVTVATALRERFAAAKPWDARALCALETADVATALGQDIAVPEVAELMGLFARSLRDLGALLLERFDGRFEGLVAAAEGSAARLVDVLASMPLYRDVSRYGGIDVPFYKRAQLAAADLNGAFSGRGPGCFRDLDRLTAFADNLVPHVLRREGALVYDRDLARRIDAGERLEPGSPEEVEIRAAAVQAVECWVDAVRRNGARAVAREIDTLLWTRGQRPEYKAHPRHRARSVFY